MIKVTNALRVTLSMTCSADDTFLLPLGIALNLCMVVGFRGDCAYYHPLIALPYRRKSSWLGQILQILHPCSGTRIDLQLPAVYETSINTPGLTIWYSYR